MVVWLRSLKIARRMRFQVRTQSSRLWRLPHVCLPGLIKVTSVGTMITSRLSLVSYDWDLFLYHVSSSSPSAFTRFPDSRQRSAMVSFTLSYAWIKY